MGARTAMRGLSVVAAILLVAGCQNNTGPAGASAARRLSLSVAASGSDSTVSTTPLAVSDSGQALMLSDTTDTLVLDTVQIIVRRIELAQADSSCAPPYEEDGNGHVDMGVWPDTAGGMATVGWGEDGCQRVKVGPVLVNVPLNGKVQKVFAAQVPAGTYDGVELRIHAPVPGDSADAAFLSTHAEFDSVSVRAVGTFDDSAFTYTHRIEARQAYHLNPPLAVTDSTPAQNLTLRVDVGAWFVRRDGTLIDPDSAMDNGSGTENEYLEHLVAWNIFRSLQTFRDDNFDGHRDHPDF